MRNVRTERKTRHQLNVLGSTIGSGIMIFLPFENTRNNDSVITFNAHTDSNAITKNI